MTTRPWITLFTLLVMPPAVADDTLTIAVASNFQSTARIIARQFTEKTNINTRISTGSTGKLYAQIVHGAPYDVFLAADVERPQALANAGAADAESLVEYAIGRLVLWSNHPRYTGQDCYKDLVAGNYDYLAIANPNTAPYGAAARKWLQAADIWAASEKALVYGENISQAFQFVATGSASLGLVSASMTETSAAGASTCNWRLDGVGAGLGLVPQAAVILSQSRRPVAAQQFIDFLGSDEVRALISSRGYHVQPAVSGVGE